MLPAKWSVQDPGHSPLLKGPSNSEGGIMSLPASLNVEHTLYFFPGEGRDWEIINSDPPVTCLCCGLRSLEAK